MPAYTRTADQDGLKDKLKKMQKEGEYNQIMALLTAFGGKANGPAWTRFGVLFRRAFIASLFILFWLFLAPVPTLLILKASDARFFLAAKSISLLLYLVFGIVGLYV